MSRSLSEQNLFCERLVRDERGFTSVGMAVSIFLCISLIFTSAQLYRVSSASAEIQEVADVSALAACNEVAEYVSAVQVCDAAILSLTLLSGTLFGLGIVAACVPPLATVSEKLIESANQVREKRDGFYEGAIKGLNSIQKLLPFLSSVNAMSVAQANNQGAMDASYFVLPALIPEQGVEFGSDADEGLGNVSSSVDEHIDGIKEQAAQAEEAAKKAAEAKEKAFKYDCGNAPSACMYERAARLSGIADEDNPAYTNVDAWSFQVPLKRIRAYYSSRKTMSISTSGTIESRADSTIRKRFYEYASKEFESAYINDGDQGFSCSLPRLFKNTDEMKETELYTEVRYPVSVHGSESVMHAWSGCPKASGASRLGSIREMDSGSFVTCSSCQFRVSSMGNVAAASTNINNGFEHHYELFRQAVEEYSDARSELDPVVKAVKEEVEPLFEMIKEVLSDAVAKRLSPDPPGKYGVILMSVNTKKPPADSGFESSFVTSNATLGTTAAVSAATLVKDTSSEGSSVITRILENAVGDFPLLDGFADAISGFWTGILRAYENGQSALDEALETSLNSFSTTTSSGLGSWVSNALKDLIGAVGLQPADIDPRMPALVNTGHVASNGGSFSTSFMKVKQSALSTSTASTSLFSSLSSIAADSVREKIDSVWVNVSSFSDQETGEGYSIEWALPGSGQSSAGLFESVLTALQQGISQLDPIRSWQ